MANPFNLFISMKVVKDHTAKCPKCGSIIIHKKLKPGEKLYCKKCKNSFVPK